MKNTVGAEEPSHKPNLRSHAAELGALGGKKGGPARAKKLSAERKREIAQAAALARWTRVKEEHVTRIAKKK